MQLCSAAADDISLWRQREYAVALQMSWHNTFRSSTGCKAIWTSAKASKTTMCAHLHLVAKSTDPRRLLQLMLHMFVMCLHLRHCITYSTVHAVCARPSQVSASNKCNWQTGSNAWCSTATLSTSARFQMPGASFDACISGLHHVAAQVLLKTQICVMSSSMTFMLGWLKDQQQGH